MSLYQKFLIGVAIVAIVGIPIFVLDTANLSWANNREAYWGMIAMLALIASLLLFSYSSKLEKQLKDNQKNKIE